MEHGRTNSGQFSQRLMEFIHAVKNRQSLNTENHLNSSNSQVTSAVNVSKLPSVGQIRTASHHTASYHKASGWNTKHSTRGIHQLVTQDLPHTSKQIWICKLEKSTNRSDCTPNGVPAYFSSHTSRKLSDRVAIPNWRGIHVRGRSARY